VSPGGRRLAGAAALAAVACVAARARAQPERTARLEAPSCAGLPFRHERLKDLLAVELAVHRVRLVNGEADDVVRYDPLRCGDPDAPIRVVVERRGVVAARLRVENEPPRALALYLAELMREPFDDPVVALLEGGRAPRPPPARPHAAAALDEPRAAASSWAMATTPREGAPPGPPGRLEDAPLLALGLLGELLYNPENQSWLIGPRLDVALRVPFYRHLRVHLDAGLGTGRSDWAVHLGAASLGLELALAAGDLERFVEVGPRFAATYVGAFGRPHAQIRQTRDGMLSIGASIRGAVRVGAGQYFTAQLEASAPLVGRIELRSNDPRNPTGGGIHDVFFVLRLGLTIE
jgi:hypothetical protein